jgi:GTP-binding protein YchF
MGFSCGIVGLPNAGKSTLFNALTAAAVDASNYPFCTIDPNVGVVEVPDDRINRLAAIFKPRKTVHTTIEFIDIAGLVKGASKGEGLGNQFLATIRNVDSVAHVVRCFEDENVAHIYHTVDPARDIEIVETELILKDIETVERKLAEAERHAKSGDKNSRAEAEFYRRVHEHLASGRLARYFSAGTEEQKIWLHQLHLLTDKPLLYVCNVHEKNLFEETPSVASVRAIAAKEGSRVAVVSAGIESEVAQLPEAERSPFLLDLGLQESGLDQLIREGYDLLHLITFFTVNPKEAHAWTVKQDTLAPQAAGVVHSDFEQGFIKAEVIKFPDLDRLGSEHAVRDGGLLHLEGREYVVQDGDVILFRFNV